MMLYDDFDEMLDDLENEEDECDDEYDGEEEEILGGIFCPTRNCFSFSFIRHGGGIIECEECGGIYNMDHDDMPYVSYGEINNAEYN